MYDRTPWLDDISSQQQVVENRILTKTTIRDGSSEDNCKWENISLAMTNIIDLPNNFPYPDFPYCIENRKDLCLRSTNQKGMSHLKSELRAD
jgi:hypothetical protein